MMDELELVHLLEDCGQQHIVGHLDLIPEPLRSRFFDNLVKQDWARVAAMHRTAGPGSPSPLPLELASVRASLPTPAERASLREEGLSMLAKGKCAFILMAGGQGSRLGYEGPKGAAPIGLPDGWTLFEMVVRRLLRLEALCGKLPWFGIMTSPENHAATEEWFAERGHPQLPSGFPRLFQQSVAPPLDERGRILLAKPAELAQAPDGNGGIWETLARTQILDSLERNGVEWIHIAGVDNLLSLPCDPVFLGFTALSGASQASKSVLRTNPAEKVGVFAETSDGAPRVAEYTELPPESAAALDIDGLPMHREANIASHMVHIDLARRFASLELPWHLARKTVPHVDPLTGGDRSSELVCKYERFIFDAFPKGGKMALLRVDRASEFAPIKNPTGVDSIESASRAIERAHRQWRESWLRRGERADSGSPRSPIVDPLESYDGEPPRFKDHGV